MNGPLDHFSNQQRERDSNSNINRDMVLLVVLVVMIQVPIQTFLIITNVQCTIGPFFNSNSKFFMFVVFEFSIQDALEV